MYNNRNLNLLCTYNVPRTYLLLLIHFENLTHVLLPVHAIHTMHSIVRVKLFPLKDIPIEVIFQLHVFIETWFIVADDYIVMGVHCIHRMNMNII